MFLTIFVKKLFQVKVGIKLGKVKKFVIGWCIPHRVVDDNAKGPASNRVKGTYLYLNVFSIIPKI